MYVRVIRLLYRLRSLLSQNCMEEVHLLSAGFDEFGELANAIVNVGSEGGGTHYTAESILQAAGHGLSDAVDRLYYGKERAFAELKTGRINAMFIVAGHPVDEFTDLEKSKEFRHFTLVPIDIEVAPQYTKTSFTKETDSFLKKDVETLSVASVMAAYDFPEGSPRREKLQRFRESLC